MKRAALIAAIALATIVGWIAVFKQSSNNQHHQHYYSWAQVHVGGTMSEVANAMGKPNDKQQFDDAMGHTECWYWGTTYQVCFDYTQHVDGKSRY